VGEDFLWSGDLGCFKARGLDAAVSQSLEELFANKGTGGEYVSGRS
jgi:hypothetical protein